MGFNSGFKGLKANSASASQEIARICQNFVIVFKQTTTCPYPELLLSIPLTYLNSLILVPFPHLALDLLSCLLPSDFPHKILSEFLFSPYVLYAPPTTSSLFCDPKILVRI